MSQRIRFREKKDKILESILYLVHTGKELDQYRVGKIFYLADREHFRRFGRPITFDKYVAMANGPVPSITYDIIKGNKVSGINGDDLPFQIEAVENIYYVSAPKRGINRGLFSKSDLVVFDDIIDRFGNWSFKSLFDYTHRDYAYTRAWDNRTAKAEEMRFEDFLAESPAKEAQVSDLEFVSIGM